MLSKFIPEYVPNGAAPPASATVDSTVRTLRSLVTLEADTRLVVIKVELHAIRLCPTGTTPTSELGFLIPANATVELSRGEADLAKLLRATADDATIQVAQYR